jgi:hypothetical protein
MCTWERVKHPGPRLALNVQVQCAPWEPGRREVTDLSKTANHPRPHHICSTGRSAHGLPIASSSHNTWYVIASVPPSRNPLYATEHEIRTYSAVKISIGTELKRWYDPTIAPPALRYLKAVAPETTWNTIGEEVGMSNDRQIRCKLMHVYNRMSALRVGGRYETVDKIRCHGEAASSRVQGRLISAAPW